VSDDGRLVAGRYRLANRIGSGAMGVVWTARDERLHRVVGVKQLLLNSSMSAAESHEAKQRAMREGRIAARLQHPHAIAVYDVAEEDGSPWLIMEYLPSRSLSALLAERGTLPPQEAARIASQAASALDAAHAAGIVHRDIKPGNILIGNDGVVKITDFGISRATGDVTVTATGMLAGTPAYLAPEVAKGYDPGPPSDVFSLGSTVYAMVEGEPPFGLNENTLALLHMVAAGQVNPPRQAGPLHALLMRLLAADPKERPTMAQAREGLAAVAAGRPVPPSVLASPSAQTWRVSPPAGTTRQTQPAPPPMGPGPTRVDPHPYDRPQSTRIGAAPMPTAMMGSGPNTRPPGLRPGEQSMPPQQRKRSRKPMIVTALAVVAAAVVGIWIASALSNSNKSRADTGGQSGYTPPAVTSQPQLTTRNNAVAPTKGTTPTTTTTTTTSSGPSNSDLVQAVSGYFALLPGNTDEAFNRLSQNMQNTSGGADGYQQFWSTVTDVKATRVQVVGKNKVAALVTYKKKDGTTSREADTFTLVRQNGELLIDSKTQTQNPLGTSGGSGGEN
jgi:eukaryotic-like serine/threonine-protein kinase